MDGGRSVNADPWMLFPAWLRNELPVPPGVATPKVRRLEFLALCRRGLRSGSECAGRTKTVWGRSQRGRLEALDSSPPHVRRQAAARDRPARDSTIIAPAGWSCRISPRRRLRWSATPIPVSDGGMSSGETGLHAQHLASLMRGKGVVVCTFEQARRRHEAHLRLRGGPLHNISTRLWDGRHTAGKTASYDGVVLDAVSSGVGSWRRHPDARWTVTAAQIPELAARQLQSLAVAAAGVRPGGTLVYTVATVTRSERSMSFEAFLGSSPRVPADPFPIPLEEGTTTGMLQIWPQAHDGEARFIAHGSPGEHRPKRYRRRKKKQESLPHRTNRERRWPITADYCPRREERMGVDDRLVPPGRDVRDRLFGRRDLRLLAPTSHLSISRAIGPRAASPFRGDGDRLTLEWPMEDERGQFILDLRPGQPLFASIAVVAKDGRIFGACSRTPIPSVSCWSARGRHPRVVRRR